MKVIIPVTTNATVQIGTVDRRRDNYIWQATFFAYGTWGSTNLAWQWSPDSGTTKLPMTDYSGAAIASTSNDSFNAQFGTGSHNTDKILLYVAATSGSGQSLTVGFFDNN